MHTEHLQNVSIPRVMLGWLVAVAVSSLVLLGAAAAGLSGSEGDAAWPGFVAVVLGFFAGGYFTGRRALRAPVLHGVAIGLMSLVVWAIVSALSSTHVLLLAGPVSLSASNTALLMLALIAAAVVGALMGYNMGVAGKPGLSEHPTPD